VKVVEVGLVEVGGVLFSGLNKVPFGFTEEGITSDIGGSEAHTEEAAVVGAMEPGRLVTEITVLAVVGEAEGVETVGFVLEGLDVALLLNGGEGHEKGREIHCGSIGNSDCKWQEVLRPYMNRQDERDFNFIKGHRTQTNTHIINPLSVASDTGNRTG
jgi:hypothetical protein